MSGDVLRFLEREDPDRFDLVVLDPPYAERAILAPLERLERHLAPGPTVVVKHFWRTQIPSVGRLIPVRERRFGETTLTFLERADGSDDTGKEGPQDA